MNVQSKIDFTVTQTRADYYNLWIIREVALAILAASLITGCSWAIKDITSFTRFTHLTPLPSWAYKTILAAATVLGIRTLFFRPLVALIIKKYAYPCVIYPIDKRLAYNWIKGGNETIALNPSWAEDTIDMVNFAIEAYDGKRIKGCILEGKKGEANSNEYIISCSGNMHLYDQVSLHEYNPTRSKGYNIVFFHPPGYGTSDGPRTPLSDFYALEAVIQYLQSKHGVKPENLHIEATSIGTGSAGAVSAKYPLKSLSFYVPLATSEGVFEHQADQIAPKISRIAVWFMASIIRDMVRYDNPTALASAYCNEIYLYEGAQDELMSLGRGPTEAQKIFNAICRKMPHVQVKKKKNAEVREETLKTSEKRIVYTSYLNKGHAL